MTDRRTQARSASERWQSALTEIEPNKILIRGYPLDEMMGRLGFAEAVYLLLMGELPTPAIGRMLNAVLVSSIDHGVTPPSTLAARNVATSGAPLKDCVAAGILASKGGKVRLLRPDELSADWDPATDLRLTAWEVVHQLIRGLEAGGESAAADLVAKLGSHAETARELAYRLYTLCERKKRAQEALSYNGLVQSWPEIVRLAGQQPEQVQKALF